jgi:hypothetical protein
MFIRCVTKIDKNTKRTYHSYKLVESYRTNRGPRQRILLQLGNNLELPQERWKELSNRIEEICLGVTTIIPYPDDIEKLAQRFAKLLIHNQSTTPLSSNNENKQKIYTSIDLESLQTSNSRSIGVEHILYETFKRLNLHKFLKSQGLNQSQVDYAAATIISRAAFPASELKTQFFLQKRSALDELMSTDFSNLSLRKLYLISDLLLENKNDLEIHLESKENEIFNLDNTIVLYDITNTYFEGVSKANPKAKYGRSKEKRRDCPLVSAGLVLNKNGFIKRSEFLPGNVIETKAFAEAITKLHYQKDSLIKPIVVIDAGMASQANIDWLKQNGYLYITVFRRKRKELPQGEWIEVVTKGDNTVRACLKNCSESGERHLYCHSSGRARRESEMKTKMQAAFEAELKYLEEGLSKPRRLKKYKAILEKIGKLKQKYKRIARFYEIDVIADEQNNVNKIIYKHVSSMLDNEFNGSYCLRTNCNNLSVKDLWTVYVMLSNAEESFRDMKAHLGLRPVHHSKENRVDGHMWITILAYHLVHSITYQLRQSNINLSWNTIRDRLNSQIRVTSSAKCEDGKLIHIRTTTEPEEFVKEIYRALGILQKPLPHTMAKM